MIKQFFFDFKTNTELDLNSFFVNNTNIEAFTLLVKKNDLNNIILIGPKKSGKSHLANIWKEQNNAVIYNNNFDIIISNNDNILIDNLFENLNEEKLFFLINHCTSNNLKMLITSQIYLYEHNFQLKDLISRLKTFNHINIEDPDDEILINIMTKLLTEKQIIIKNKEIFNFLLKRINRTYEEVYNLINKMDKLSLEKKKQLTIPSIKELI